jgi:hypothetical protein
VTVAEVNTCFIRGAVKGYVLRTKTNTIVSKTLRMTKSQAF